MTIHDLWTQAAARHHNLPALGWVGETPWSFAQVSERVDALQARFQQLGVSEGGKIALWAPNHPGWGVVYLAVTTGPWTVVPILPEFSCTDMANVLVHSGTSLLIVGRSLGESWNQWLSTASTEIKKALTGLRLEIFEDLVEAPLPTAKQQATALRRPSETDLASLIYTSGTTGSPKGVMLTHSNLASNVVSAAPLVGFVPGDSMLSVLPLAHTYECTLGLLIPLHEGAQVHYLPKPPAPAVLLPALALVRPHAMLTVPLFMEKIYRSKVKPSLESPLLRVLRWIPGLDGVFTKIAGAKLKKTFGGRLKFFGVGGAPLAPEVAKFLERSGFPYAIGYGLTETSPLVAGHRNGNLYSTGRVLKGVEVKIAEPRNAQGAGEILVKGPNVMAGYYRDPVKTAEVMTADGWFRTGDLGFFDKDQHLHINGRSKNLILGPSGENIYPEALEALINQDSKVVESLVLQRGQEIVAKVVLAAEGLGDLEAYLEGLKHHINRQVARFSRISFLEAQEVPFEKTATLKIKRYLYR